MILTVTLNPSVDHSLFVGPIKLHDTNRVQRTERDAGGKGVNLSRVVAELGGETIATGFLGGGAGAMVRQVLNDQSVAHDFTDVAGETRTNFSVESGDGPPTAFNERGPEISAEELATFWSKLRNHLKNAEWLAIGGSIPRGLPTSIYAEIVHAAHKAGVKVMLDADGESMKLGLAEAPTFIKPNKEEASRLMGRPVETLEQAREAALELHQHVPIVVLSRGEEGAVLACENGVFSGQAPIVEVKSTIGSGDSLLAGMMWSMNQGDAPEQALRWGIACGAATATTSGAEIARRPVILALYDRIEIQPL